MKHYLFDGNTVLEEVKSNENGLTQQEADARLEQNGKNKPNAKPCVHEKDLRIALPVGHAHGID